jgi:hypothetical protein
MIRRKFRRRPDFESLESMQLLSGAGVASSHAMALHPMVQQARAHQTVGEPRAGVPLSLSGVVQGRYRITGGAAATFSGRGKLGSAGMAQLRGTIALVSAGNGELTLSFGRRGKIFANVTGGALGGDFTYQITGGTRSFAGDTGSGAATVQIPGLRPQGHFTLILQG